MKLLLSIFLILSSIQFANASYDCNAALSDDYSADSKSYRLSEFDVEADFDSNPALVASQSVEKLYENLGCRESNSKSNMIVKCKEIVKGVSHSNVCYLQNDEGYFLISKDMLENINIIYNRWD